MNGNSVKVFAGKAAEPLAHAVCKSIDLTLGQAQVEQFNDGEPRIQILENVRAEDVFIMASITSAGILLETVLLAKAARYSSARRVTLVIPYLLGNRQDRKNEPRTPVTAKVVIDMLKLTDADRALLVDVHSEATLPHFEPMVYDQLYASTVSVPYLQGVLEAPFVVGSPDAGGGVRARFYASRLDLHDYVVFDKKRTEPGKVADVKIIGDVVGKNILLVDDIIDTAGTIIADASAAKAAGAKGVRVFATHAVFSGRSAESVRGVLAKLDESDIDEVIITDTIPHPPELLKTSRVKITVISVAGLLGQAIRRLHDDRSLSELILK